ncbi:MAG: rod shape-determining protein MreD [Alphaproteobacteria bacterium]|nr:rod shape-determining protein MreD [Alphaproteobacteria bacterium]
MAVFAPRDRQSFWQRLDALARLSFPTLVALLLVVLAAVPLRLPEQGGVMPLLPMVAVFFWALYRPQVLPAPAVFAIGLLADLVAATPLGVSVIVLLLLYGTVGIHRRRLARQSFLVVWLAFLLYLAGAQLLTWLLNTLLSLRLFPPGPALFQFALTAALYPVMAYLLALADRSILPERPEGAR